MICISKKEGYYSVFISTINETFYIDNSGIFKDPDFEYDYELSKRKFRLTVNIPRIYYKTDQFLEILNKEPLEYRTQLMIQKILFENT